MRYRFLRFPKGRGKALTLSYDDGCVYDKKLIEKYGDSGLLNLIAIRLGKEKLGEVLAGICESGDIHSEYLN